MIAYFDCYSGVAGDMILGAMLDTGLPFSYLKRELAKLYIGGYKLVRRIERRGVVGGVNLQVVSKPTTNNRRPTTNDQRYKNIRRLILKSSLNKNTRNISLAIFETLAHAEAHVHRTLVDQVHFHEVGAIDSIVDIVGAAIGFDYFGFDEIYSSPLPITRGWVTCRHGKMPVPAPATLEILKGVPIVSSPVKAEIVTPTGAAVLKTVVKSFGENPLREIEKIGYGHGDNHYKEIPNSLRLMIGEGENLIIIEANIDDANPQIYEYVIEELLALNASDVVVRPVYMKKRRPAAQLQVLCRGDLKKKIIDKILKETPTFGVRYYPVERVILDRKFKTVQTKYGAIRVKMGFLDGNLIKTVPEYEDVKKLARQNSVPLVEIYKYLNA